MRGTVVFHISPYEARWHSTNASCRKGNPKRGTRRLELIELKNFTSEPVARHNRIKRAVQ